MFTPSSELTVTKNESPGINPCAVVNETSTVANAANDSVVFCGIAAVIFSDIVTVLYDLTTVPATAVPELVTLTTPPSVATSVIVTMASLVGVSPPKLVPNNLILFPTA